MKCRKGLPHDRPTLSAHPLHNKVRLLETVRQHQGSAVSSAIAPPPFRTRTDVLFASEAPFAVVHRRGPRLHHQLLLWDTRKDTFTPGQWMKGLVRLCDLAPDGGKLIYWAAQYHSSAPRHDRPRSAPAEEAAFDPIAAPRRFVDRLRSKHPHRKLPRYLGGGSGPPNRPPPRENQCAWTAVSNPPYFSALAVWPCLGHWTGGGYFASSRTIAICEPQNAMTPLENVPAPTGYKIFSFLDPRVAKPIPEKLARSPRRHLGECQRAVAEALVAAGVHWFDWANFADDGDILFACDGSIYRHAGTPANIGPDLLHNARRLIDLSPARFELIRAPNAAMRW